MTNSRDPVTEADLHAIVDGRLTPDRRAEVEAYLSTHPNDAARLQGYQEQKAALHALFDPVLNEEIPLNMYRPIRRPAWRTYVLRAAAAALYLFVGGVAGWWLHSARMLEEAATVAFVEQAAIAHTVYTPEVRHPVEVTAKQEVHLVKWLSKRLGTKVQAPQLVELGYHLVGGRLLPGARSPAAQFMFEDERGVRLTLYVRRNDGFNKDMAFRFAQEGRVSLFYWIDGPLGYALVGEIERAALLQVANAVYRQINR